MVRSMMDHVDLPKTFWGYTLMTTIYLLNRVPMKAISTTPYEVLTSKKSLISYLKIWGCPAYVKSTISDKLDAKSDKCLFIGYPKETKGYQFYHLLEQKVFILRHATILVKELLLQEAIGSMVELDEIQETPIDTNEMLS